MKNSKTKNKARNTGLRIAAPARECSDKKCPFHGELNVKKRTFVGIVTSSKPQKTAIIAWNRRYYIPKFERYEIRKTKLSVHNPLCIDAKEKEIVRVIETRPISKTKHFVIIEKLGYDKKIEGEDVTLKEKEGKEEAKEHEKAAEKSHEKTHEKTAKKEKHEAKQ